MHIAGYIMDLAARMGHWNYAVVFVVVVLECQALLGLFMPGESLVLMNGFLAGQGLLDLDASIATVSLAAILGDSIGYELGKHYGRDWLQRKGRLLGIGVGQLDKVEGYLRHHGGKSVFVSHFMHLLRAFMPFTAGAAGLPYRRFLSYNALGCILWATVFELLGYFFGQNWRLLEKWLGRAGAVIGVLLFFVVFLVWLWHWLLRHENELREQWRVFLEQPRVSAFRRRMSPQIRFLQNRLTPGGYLGLHLTLGALVILLATWWFGGVVEDVVTGDPLVAVDYRVASWFNEHGTPELTRAARIVTFFGSPGFLTGATVVLAIILGWRRLWYPLLALVLTMGGGSLLNLGLKTVFQRDRPPLSHSLDRLSSYSFPSGHTMGSTMFYLFAALTAGMLLKRWRWRLDAVLLAVTFVLVIGLSRIYLVVHYLSDVMGAMAAGLAWLAICLTATETIRRYRLNEK